MKDIPRILVTELGQEIAVNAWHLFRREPFRELFGRAVQVTAGHDEILHVLTGLIEEVIGGLLI